MPGVPFKVTDLLSGYDWVTLQHTWTLKRDVWAALYLNNLASMKTVHIYIY